MEMGAANHRMFSEQLTVDNFLHWTTAQNDEPITTILSNPIDVSPDVDAWSNYLPDCLKNFVAWLVSCFSNKTDSLSTQNNMPAGWEHLLPIMLEATVETEDEKTYLACGEDCRILIEDGVNQNGSAEKRIFVYDKKKNGGSGDVVSHAIETNHPSCPAWLKNSASAKETLEAFQHHIIGQLRTAYKALPISKKIALNTERYKNFILTSEKAQSINLKLTDRAQYSEENEDVTVTLNGNRCILPCITKDELLFGIRQDVYINEKKYSDNDKKNHIIKAFEYETILVAMLEKKLSISGDKLYIALDDNDLGTYSAHYSKPLKGSTRILNKGDLGFLLPFMPEGNTATGPFIEGFTYTYNPAPSNTNARVYSVNKEFAPSGQEKRAIALTIPSSTDTLTYQFSLNISLDHFRQSVLSFFLTNREVLESISHPMTSQQKAIQAEPKINENWAISQKITRNIAEYKSKLPKPPTGKFYAKEMLDIANASTECIKDNIASVTITHGNESIILNNMTQEELLFGIRQDIYLHPAQYTDDPARADVIRWFEFDTVIIAILEGKASIHNNGTIFIDLNFGRESTHSTRHAKPLRGYTKMWSTEDLGKLLSCIEDGSKPSSSPTQQITLTQPTLPPLTTWSISTQPSSSTGKNSTTLSIIGRSSQENTTSNTSTTSTTHTTAHTFSLDISADELVKKHTILYKKHSSH